MRGDIDRERIVSPSRYLYQLGGFFYGKNFVFLGIWFIFYYYVDIFKISVLLMSFGELKLGSRLFLKIFSDFFQWRILEAISLSILRIEVFDRLVGGEGHGHRWEDN